VDGFKGRAWRFITWSDEDKIRFIQHVQHNQSELWTEYLGQVRDTGFCVGRARGNCSPSLTV
jgi:hypothetical protein